MYQTIEIKFLEVSDKTIILEASQRPFIQTILDF